MDPKLERYGILRTLRDIGLENNEQYTELLLLESEIGALIKKGGIHDQEISRLKSPEFLETIAELEHKQWIEWATTLMQKEKLSLERTQRWKTLLIDYKNLPNEHKESDKVYARLVIKEILG